jgi:hypothetical protein
LSKDWGFNALALIFFIVVLYSLIWRKSPADGIVDPHAEGYPARAVPL